MGNQNEINAEVKFIEVGGKFIWKIYDANGSVVEKAKEMFDNKEACEADFNAFCETSETVGIEDVETNQNPAGEVETTPETPEGIETTPAEVVSEEVLETQPVEQSQPETAIETTEVKTEVAPEGAIEGSAEGIETAKL